MKILDMKNAPARLKVFILWGALLFAVQYGSLFLLGSSLIGLFISVAIVLVFSVFVGYMTAAALKNKTGDKRSSAIYGAIVPIFSSIIGLVVALATGAPLSFSVPWLSMLAGLLGGYLSQKRF